MNQPNTPEANKSLFYLYSRFQEAFCAVSSTCDRISRMTPEGCDIPPQHRVD
jgi:hypothetical protein